MEINPKSSFWSKVDIRGHDDCWEWQGYRNRQGYGQTADGYSHKLAWEKANGREMDGLACHRCNNPPCCNPSHVYEGTPAQNTDDARRAGTLFKSRNVGTNNPAAKLTEIEVSVIKARIAAGDHPFEVAYTARVSEGTIRSIAKGRIWRHVEPWNGTATERESVMRTAMRLADER